MHYGIFMQYDIFNCTNRTLRLVCLPNNSKMTSVVPAQLPQIDRYEMMVIIQVTHDAREDRVESGGQLPRIGTTPTLGITVLYVPPREGSMTHMHDSQ